MKKTLALTLALVLCLGLCAPALAAEEGVSIYYVDGQPVETVPAGTVPELKSIADESQEVQDFLYEMYQNGDLTQENTDYDLSYFEDGGYEYVDPYAEYEAAHSEEIAALDADALIAQWGYHDMTAEEAFMEDYADYGETLDEAVKDRYIQMRLLVQEDAQMAEEYREELPEVWADFDADAYFQTTYDWDKAEYMAWYCLRSQEEFVDDMFTDYIEYDYDVWDEDYDWDEPAGEPTLTLVVNGVASDVAITAGEGTTYADADALRAILGAQAVAADATGSIAIRPAAEAAGWDVVWYEGWGEQEVQLWNKTAFQAEVAEGFEAYEDFAARLAEQNKVWLETAGELNETLELKLTRFDTLDGDRTYTAKAKVEAVMEDGVMDCVINVDAAGFGALLDVARQAGWSVEDAAVAQMKKTMGDVKVEMIADLEEGEAAYRVPALALLDPDLANWQRLELGSAETVISSHDSVLEAGYQTMLKNAATMGGVYAWNSAMEDIEHQVATLGADRFTTAADGTVTYALTAQDMEESGYKRCEVRCVMKPDGWYTLELDMRPDLMSSVLGSAEYLDEEELFQVLVYDLLGSFFDMEAAVKLEVNRDSATASVEFHWSNMGKLEFGGTARRSAADRHPRQVKDVLPLAVKPAPGTVLTAAF